MIHELPENCRKKAERLAELSHLVAPEHGVSTYGRPSEGLAPWEIYGEEDARKILEMAREAYDLMRQILRKVRR